MLVQTNYTTDPSLFQEACKELPKDGSKIVINQPTGNFFYDAWVIKDEYKGTVWETLYDSLPVTKGEARIIILDPAQCYQSHADIDDRYHLNILGDQCYLIDLVRESMHLLQQDGIWYDMDASFIHTAANFGRRARIQLVVRKLLKKNKLTDPVPVKIVTTMENKNHARYLFDNTLSTLLNEANKAGYINDFAYSDRQVTFNIEKQKLSWLEHILPSEFTLA